LCAYSRLFSFSSLSCHRDLLSFPTRRSSDLIDQHGRTLAGNRLFVEHHTFNVFLGRQLVHSAQQGLFNDGTQPTRTRTALDGPRSEEHTSELQSRENLVCRLLLEKKNTLNHQ